MASTYSALKIELIGTGEQSGTWGAITNANLNDSGLGAAITGSADVVFASADVTVTLSNTNTAQTARNLRLNLTGTSGGARQLILGSGCQISKLYLINNGLADAVTVKNTTGTGTSVAAGKTMFVFNDGTNVVEAVNFASSLSTGNLAYTGTLTGGTGVVNLGSGQFYKDASGNIGVGTTSTGAGVLNMYSTGASTARAVLTGTTNYSVFQSKNSGGDFYFGIDNSTGSGFNSGAYGRVIYSGNGSYPTVFFTNDLERMRITGAGNVGIGTSSPAQKLSVSDASTSAVEIVSTGATAQLMLSSSGTNPAYINYNRGGAGVLAFYDTNAAAERMRIDSSGNVGIGTTTTTYRTNIVYANSAGGVAETGLYLRNTTTGNSTQIQLDGNRSFSLLVQGSFGSPAGGFTIQDNTANANRLSIDSSGNVGIGTSSPSQKLNVSGNARFEAASGNRYIEVASSTSSLQIGTDGSSQFIYGVGAFPLTFSTNASERMRIDSSGRLLVGLSSSIGSVVAKLQVSNGSTGIAIGSWDGPAIGNYVSGDSSGTLQFTFGRDNVSTGDFVFAYNGVIKASISAATGVYTPLSDIRVKKNIEPLQYGLNEILKLKPVIYNMVAENDDDKKHKCMAWQLQN